MMHPQATFRLPWFIPAWRLACILADGTVFHGRSWRLAIEEYALIEVLEHELAAGHPPVRPLSDNTGEVVFADGTVFHGRAFGACGSPATTTAMSGYQEALTDPSYAGQILTMTAPMIGNYGISPEDVESARPQVAGFVIRELSRITSNYRSTTDLSTWLAEHGILGIEGIDTRALVRTLRITGAMNGVISCDQTKSDDELIAMAKAAPSMAGMNLACTVSPRESGTWSEGLGEWRTLTPAHSPGLGRDGGAFSENAPSPAVNPGQGRGSVYRVLALDCGAKRNIYRNLTERGCEVHIAPHDITPEEIRAFKPDGLFISNGPGDPAAVEQTIETLREVAGEVPTFGICLGHQLLALALGAKTYKLKFGHRGANQPVKNLLTGRVEITSQNHGFCVDADSLAKNRLRADPHPPQRRHARGLSPPHEADFQRTTPPGGLTRTARRRIPLRLVRADDADRPTAGGIDGTGGSASSGCRHALDRKLVGRWHDGR
jgi:carbamoyl-phosphate synthase small subunit